MDKVSKQVCCRRTIHDNEALKVDIGFKTGRADDTFIKTTPGISMFSLNMSIFNCYFCLFFSSPYNLITTESDDGRCICILITAVPSWSEPIIISSREVISAVKVCIYQLAFKGDAIICIMPWF